MQWQTADQAFKRTFLLKASPLSSCLIILFGAENPRERAWNSFLYQNKLKKWQWEKVKESTKRKTKWQERTRRKKEEEHFCWFQDRQWIFMPFWTEIQARKELRFFPLTLIHKQSWQHSSDKASSRHPLLTHMTYSIPLELLSLIYLFLVHQQEDWQKRIWYNDTRKK